MESYTDYKYTGQMYTDPILNTNIKDALQKLCDGEWDHYEYEAWCRLRGKENQFGRMPSEILRNRRKQMKQDDFEASVFGGMIVLGIVVAVFMVFKLLFWAILAFVAIFLIPTLMKRRIIMKDFLARITGVRIVNMKLSAVADYLKVAFKHIPEHYICEKTEK